MLNVTIPVVLEFKQKSQLDLHQKLFTSPKKLLYYLCTTWRLWSNFCNLSLLPICRLWKRKNGKDKLTPIILPSLWHFPLTPIKGRGFPSKEVFEEFSNSLEFEGHRTWPLPPVGRIPQVTQWCRESPAESKLWLHVVQRANGNPEEGTLPWVFSSVTPFHWTTWAKEHGRGWTTISRGNKGGFNGSKLKETCRKPQTSPWGGEGGQKLFMFTPPPCSRISLGWGKL